MKVAYSCAGEGFGHAARMVVLAKHLDARHELTCYVPETIRKFLSDKGCAVRSSGIPGFAFVKKGDSVLLGRSILHNLPLILMFPFLVADLAIRLRREGFQRVISDFEPLLAWAGKLAGIPVIQFNHPGIISKFPGQGAAAFLSVLGARLMEGPWDRRIHVSFFAGDVGPLLRKSLFANPVKREPYLLLNLKESYRPQALKALEKCPGLSYKIFPAPGDNFEKALAECMGVVSSAGHQIIAEAMALGKPILLLPQKDQYEQVLNAHMLGKTGRGMTGSLDTLDRDLPEFLSQLDRLSSAFSKPLPPGFTFSDGTVDAFDRIDRMLEQAGETFLQPAAELIS